MLHGKVEGISDIGRPKKDWMDNSTQWPDKTTDELLRKVKEDRDGWRRCVIVANEMISLRCMRHGIKSK